MAYNPNLYSWAYGQLVPQYMQYQPQPTNGLVRVKGRQGADAFPMAPNSVSPVLLDEDQDVFYIKRTDASGVGTVDEYDFAPRARQQETEEAASTTAMIERLAAKVEALTAAVEKGQEQRARRRKVEDDGQ